MFGSKRHSFLLLVLVANLVSVIYYFKNSDATQDFVDQPSSHVHSRQERSAHFDDATTTKLIHVVRDDSSSRRNDGLAKEIGEGFGECLNYRNCELREHVVTRDTKPNMLPTSGSAVLITAKVEFFTTYDHLKLS